MSVVVYRLNACLGHTHTHTRMRALARGNCCKAPNPKQRSPRFKIQRPEDKTVYGTLHPECEDLQRNCNYSTRDAVQPQSNKHYVGLSQQKDPTIGQKSRVHRCATSKSPSRAAFAKSHVLNIAMCKDSAGPSEAFQLQHMDQKNKVS